jgi:hypothetical protein
MCLRIYVYASKCACLYAACLNAACLYAACLDVSTLLCIRVSLVLHNHSARERILLACERLHVSFKPMSLSSPYLFGSERLGLDASERLRLCQSAPASLCESAPPLLCAEVFVRGVLLAFDSRRCLPRPKHYCSTPAPPPSLLVVPAPLAGFFRMLSSDIFDILPATMGVCVSNNVCMCVYVSVCMVRQSRCLYMHARHACTCLCGCLYMHARVHPSMLVHTRPGSMQLSLALSLALREREKERRVLETRDGRGDGRARAVQGEGEACATAVCIRCRRWVCGS